MKNNFLGFDIQINPLSKIIFKNKTTVINTINPHSYCVAKKDLNFEKALKSSNILLPDDIGIVWAEKFLNGKKIKKLLVMIEEQFYNGKWSKKCNSETKNGIIWF